MALNILDALRMILVGVAFFFGYQIGFGGAVYDPVAQLHFTVPIVIFAVAGISGLEGLFFGKQAAEAKGFDAGGNYQRQSSIAMVSYAAVAALVYFCNWGIYAELTILFAFCFFFIFSGLNHAIDAVKNKNYKWQNINRPFITLVMLAGLFYPVFMALKGLA
jgi:hypothetical protein